MINLRLPSNHPNSPVIQRWATDKERLLEGHSKRITHLEEVIKTLLDSKSGQGKAQ